MATRSGARKLPTYVEVDGFRLPGGSCAEAFRSALAYRPVPGDLFVASYPKCGTTWLLNVVACIRRAGEPFEAAACFLKRVTFLEIEGAASVRAEPGPAVIKTHLPFHMTPVSREAKYIFVARNPKDCCVSFYHHTKMCKLYDFEGGDFDVFFELFMQGQTDFGDYFDCLLSWYEHGDDPNVLFITYEDLKRDTKANVLKIAGFMGPQYKEMLEKDGSLLNDVIRHSSFDFMKEHLGNIDSSEKMANRISPDREPSPSVPRNPSHTAEKRLTVTMQNPSISFIRKGIVGDWRNHFSLEQSERLEKKFTERTAGTNLADLWTDVM